MFPVPEPLCDYMSRKQATLDFVSEVTLLRPHRPTSRVNTESKVDNLGR